MDLKYLYPNSEISGVLFGTFSDVDDPYNAPDEDATYVEYRVCIGTGADLYGIQDQEDIGTIAQITVYYRWRSVTLGEEGEVAGCWCKIKTHGTEYYISTSVTPSTTYKTENKVWTTNPYTGEAWTWEEINDLQIKILSQWTGVGYAYARGRCTQVYVKVEGDWYDPPTVVTSAADDIDHESATLNGNVTSIGGLNVTSRGFEYKTGITTKDITAASKEDPCNITATGHGFITGDTVIIVNVGGMTELNGKTYVITKVDDNNFTLDDIDSTGYTEYTSGGTCEKWEGDVSSVSEEGDFETGVFDEIITGLDPYIHYYFRAFAINPVDTSYGLWLDFTTTKCIPVLTTQDATGILQSQITGNGNITQDGGEACTERGFEYSLTKNNPSEVHDTGSYSEGAYTKDITLLLPNTEYWYRAFAENSIGYGYGEWVKFQTAAPGTTPAGTKISICSDYTGHTYILNKSLTDDGNAYESCFVISTDLADKQGLHFKKGLLDLYSYFENKASGTCKIYVKRDNETTWQYAGEISMTGDEDIIVKHLPSENQDSNGDVDFLAKHYLIKFVFQNDFDFIGLVTEAVWTGVR